MGNSQFQTIFHMAQTAYQNFFIVWFSCRPDFTGGYSCSSSLGMEPTLFSFKYRFPDRNRLRRHIRLDNVDRHHVLSDQQRPDPDIDGGIDVGGDIRFMLERL
jgi:hypothetical protein